MISTMSSGTLNFSCDALSLVVLFDLDKGLEDELFDDDLLDDHF